MQQGVTRQDTWVTPRSEFCIRNGRDKKTEEEVDGGNWEETEIYLLAPKCSIIFVQMGRWQSQNRYWPATAAVATCHCLWLLAGCHSRTKFLQIMLHVVQCADMFRGSCCLKVREASVVPKGRRLNPLCSFKKKKVDQARNASIHIIREVSNEPKRLCNLAWRPTKIWIMVNIIYKTQSCD